MLELFKTFRFGINELLWIGYLIFNFTAIILAYRFWGKIGLFALVPLSIVLANIQVVKMMNLFGVETTMGNIAFGGVFLISDILSENEGKKYAKKVVSIGFISMIFSTIVMQIALKIEAGSGDTMQGHLSQIFGLLPQIALGSILGFIASQAFDIWAYQIIKKIKPEYKDIWIRNNASTMISQIIDNMIFTFIAFWGTYSVKQMIVIVFSTYFLKLFIAFMDTPFVYIATLWKKQGKIKELGTENE
ncbi:MAG: queuosine precursor transporter [Leptotrichiaceae bacterium]|nr:queuosine precursor transporter [Leptotrichiaceae bacterium]